MKAFVVAAPASGSGKTTVSAGIIGALRARGLRVAPFKAGPDYIDPGHLAAAAGVPCRNLDTWMLPAEAIRQSLARAAAWADVAVVEGVMGLFDGHSAEGEAGSTAHLAKLLGLPVVLVVDASAMARSAAAIVFGFRGFDPDLRVAAVIANRLGSERHLDLVANAVENQAGLPVLGGLLRDPGIALPERYLGLVTSSERTDIAALDRMASETAGRIDLDGLLALAAEVAPAPPNVAATPPATGRTPLAVARDEAFSFYYEDSLDLLREAGAELLPFSPLRDSELPPGVRGVLIGGGFPELFARQLAENRGMHRALRAADAAGMPIVAECGGLMLLGTTLTDADGTPHAMAGLTPIASSMLGARLTLGYREVRARQDGPLFAAGDVVRGHEFHLSTSEPPGEGNACWDVLEPHVGWEGYARGALHSSYVHLHLGAAPTAAGRFLAAMRAGQR